MTALPFKLERTILIHAERDTVFRYFTDSERFARWWGAGSSIEGRPGGRVFIRHPNGVTNVGEVLEIDAGRRVVFTYGYEDPAKPIPPGGSRVTIRLEDDPAGTRLHLLHELADATTRDHHVGGWRYQLALFANVTADEQHAQAARTVDRYFALWNEADAAARQAGFAALLAPDASYGDRFGCTRGPSDLSDHVGAVLTFMPGLTLGRDGELRHCQGSALVEWAARGADGQVKSRGTNAFDFTPDGRMSRIVGFWATGPA